MIKVETIYELDGEFYTKEDIDNAETTLQYIAPNGASFNTKEDAEKYCEKQKLIKLAEQNKKQELYEKLQELFNSEYPKFDPLLEDVLRFVRRNEYLFMTVLKR